MSNYADDNFILRIDKNLVKLIMDMKKSLEAVTKWLKKLGLKVDKSETEICLFHRSSEERLNLMVKGIEIKIKSNMNVVGVIFHSKLQWNDHVAHTINKCY